MERASTINVFLKEIFKKTSSKRLRIRLFLLSLEGVIFLIVVGIYFWQQRPQVLPETRLIDHSSTTPTPLVPFLTDNKLAFEGDEEIAYLQDGKMWLVDKFSKKEMLYDLTQVQGAVVGYNFSPDNQTLYWLTSEGGLWKADVDGSPKSLITQEEMVETTFQDPSTKESVTFLKGKVLSFSLSSDGEYLAYETLERYTGCCLGPSDTPVKQIRIMKNNGSGKVVVQRPAIVFRELMVFDGWIPGQQKVLFHFRSVDSSVSGSSLFEAGVNGKTLGKLSGMVNSEASDSMIVAGGLPVFSPDGENMAYVEDGVLGKGKVWLSRLDGQDKKVILEKGAQIRSASYVIQWSRSGDILLIKATDKLLVFKKDGELVYEADFENPENLELIVSPKDQAIVGVYQKKEEKSASVFFINLQGDKAISWLEIPASGLRVIPLLTAENGRIYYLKAKNSRSGADFSPTALWVFDTKNDSNEMIAENVSWLTHVFFGRETKIKSPTGLEGIGIYAISPTQLLAIAPNGKKTGFDPETSQILEEISKSQYYFERALGDVTGQNPPPPPDAGQNKLTINFPPEFFTLIVTSKDGFYSFAFYASGQNLLEFESFSGPILPGEKVIYEFQYNPILDFPFEYQIVKD
ncbi:hypothetical protein ACFL0Y_01540 [Patescibacteria group bacterium]